MAIERQVESVGYLKSIEIEEQKMGIPGRSGHFGHAGRRGQVGGSSNPEGSSAGKVSDKAKKTLDIVASKLQEYASLRKREALVFVNNDSGIRSEYFPGTAMGVRIDPRTVSGLASTGNNWTAIHCHPGSFKDSSPSSFGPKDLSGLSEKHITRIEVVGPNKDRFIIERGKVSPSSFLQISRELASVSKGLEKDYARLSKGLDKKGKEDLWAKQSHEANKILAGKYGYSYEKIAGAKK